MVPSLWARYIEELRGGSVKFIEYPGGFVSWSFLEWADDCIMVRDIYVLPEYRKSGLGRQMFDEVCDIGRKAGKRYVTSELHLDTHIYAESMKAQLAVGLVIVAAEPGKILLRKEILL